MGIITKFSRYPNGLSGLSKNDGQNTVVQATSRDSAGVIGTVPPGQTGLKLTDPTQQSATAISVSSNAVVHDDFKRQNQVLTASPNWGDAGFGLSGVIFNGGYSVKSGGTLAANVWKTNFGPNAFCQITAGAVHEGIYCCFNGPGEVFVPALIWVPANGPTWAIGDENGVITDTGITAKVGDIARFEMYASGLLRAIINGVLVATAQETGSVVVESPALKLVNLSGVPDVQISDFWAGSLDGVPSNFTDDTYVGQAAGYSILGE